MFGTGNVPQKGSHYCVTMLCHADTSVHYTPLRLKSVHDYSCLWSAAQWSDRGGQGVLILHTLHYNTHALASFLLVFDIYFIFYSEQHIETKLTQEI